MSAIKKILQKIVSYGLKLVATLIVIVLIVMGFAIEPVNIHGSSMEPQLKDKDVVLYSRSLLASSLRSYSRNDIIVFEYGKTRQFIKKIIALPGETVVMSKGTISIQAADEGIVISQIKVPLIGQIIRLKENEYFVIGINYKESQDSRHLGPIKVEEIIGTALIKIWPWSEVELL